LQRRGGRRTSEHRLTSGCRTNKLRVTFRNDDASCLDVAGVLTAKDAKVQQWACGNGLNQQGLFLAALAALAALAISSYL